HLSRPRSTCAGGNTGGSHRRAGCQPRDDANARGGRTGQRAGAARSADGLRRRQRPYRRVSAMPRFNFWTVVMIFTWLMLFVLLFIPVGSVLISSLYDQQGNLTLANYLKFLGEPRFRQA